MITDSLDTSGLIETMYNTNLQYHTTIILIEIHIERFVQGMIIYVLQTSSSSNCNFVGSESYYFSIFYILIFYYRLLHKVQFAMILIVFGLSRSLSLQPLRSFLFLDMSSICLWYLLHYIFPNPKNRSLSNVAYRQIVIFKLS